MAAKVYTLVDRQRQAGLASGYDRESVYREAVRLFGEVGGACAVYESWLVDEWVDYGRMAEWEPARERGDAS